MSYPLVALILVFCVPAFFVNEDLTKRMAVFAGLALALGGVGMLWASHVPKNFFVAHPELAQTPLNPEMASLAGGLLVLFGVGLFLTLGCRILHRYFEASRR